MLNYTHCPNHNLQLRFLFGLVKRASIGKKTNEAVFKDSVPVSGRETFCLSRSIMVTPLERILSSKVSKDSFLFQFETFNEIGSSPAL